MMKKKDKLKKEKCGRNDEKPTTAISDNDWKIIFQAIGKPSFILTPQHDIIAVNREAIKIIGLPENGIVNKKCYELIHNTDSPPHGCPMVKLINTNDGEASEMRVEALNKIFMVACTPIVNKNGILEKVVHVASDVTDVRGQAIKTTAELKEKEMLLGEIHHRVKNNLQIISSLLDLYCLRVTGSEAVTLFTDARTKIYSMALIHSQLYRSSQYDKINMNTHIVEITRHLFDIYGRSRNITFSIKVDSVYLSITQAIPCALIINEIISNAFLALINFLTLTRALSTSSSTFFENLWLLLPAHPVYLR